MLKLHSTGSSIYYESVERQCRPRLQQNVSPAEQLEAEEFGHKRLIPQRHQDFSDMESVQDILGNDNIFFMLLSLGLGSVSYTHLTLPTILRV